MVSKSYFKIHGKFDLRLNMDDPFYVTTKTNPYFSHTMFLFKNDICHLRQNLVKLFLAVGKRGDEDYVLTRFISYDGRSHSPNVYFVDIQQYKRYAHRRLWGGNKLDPMLLKKWPILKPKDVYHESIDRINKMFDEYIHSVNIIEDIENSI